MGNVLEDGADNAQAPDSAQPETTAAETASATTPQQPDYAALMAQMKATADAAQAATKAAQAAAQFAHKRDQELANYRRQETQQSSGYGRQDEAPDEAAVQRQAQDQQWRALMEFKLAKPDHVERLPDMLALTQDPAFAQTYGDNLNNLITFHEAYRQVGFNRIAKENEELRAAKGRQATTREAGKVQAQVSGGGAAEQQQVISEADLQNMTLAEMEKKFGKEALRAGIAAMWSPQAR